QTKTMLAIMVVLLASELIWNGSQYNKTFPAQLIYRETLTTNFLKNNIGQYRFLVAPADFRGKAGAIIEDKIVAPPNTFLPYQLASIAGKNQLFPKWYREIAALVEPQNELSHIIFNQQQSPIYDLLGVKYLLTKEKKEVLSPSYQEVYHNEGIRIYENLNVMPRAFFASQVKVANLSELEMMGEDGFDPHTTVIVQTKTIDPKDISVPTSADQVEIKEYKNNEVTLQAFTIAKRLLVLTDTYYPGWEVFVDGNKVELLRVNHAMRGVVLNSGKHQIKFVFWPSILSKGLLIAAIVFLGLILEVLRVSFRRIWTNKSLTRISTEN
ncbi:MAG: hypothetical protein FD167_2671, partial [bacterium]